MGLLRGAPRSEPLRWDPSIKLQATSDAPVGLGTVINRRVTRFGRTTEGRMEVVEYEPEQLMPFETHDGPMTIHGRARFEALGPDGTRLTIGGDIPGIDDAVAAEVRAMMDRSTASIKSLVESGP